MVEAQLLRPKDDLYICPVGLFAFLEWLFQLAEAQALPRAKPQSRCVAEAQALPRAKP